MSGPKENKMMKFMENYIYRGIFHIWYAISLWVAFSNSLHFVHPFSPKTTINIMSWLMLSIGVVEMTIGVVRYVRSAGRMAKLGTKDHLNNEIIVNRAEFRIKSEKPYCRRLFEGLRTKKKQDLDQTQNTIPDTINLSNCMPITSRQQFLDENFDCEDISNNHIV